VALEKQVILFHRGLHPRTYCDSQSTLVCSQYPPVVCLNAYARGDYGCDHAGRPATELTPPNPNTFLGGLNVQAIYNLFMKEHFSRAPAFRPVSFFIPGRFATRKTLLGADAGAITVGPFAGASCYY